MNEFIIQLSEIIKNSPRVAFLGIGSPLRGDDNVGNYIVAKLMEILKSHPGQEFCFCLGESAPENFTGEIREFAPDHLVIFDAAELNVAPGTFSLIGQEQIEGVSFASHILPLKIICAYLITTAGCQVIVVGVQPETLQFDQPLSPIVKKSADCFIADFCKLLNKSN